MPCHNVLRSSSREDKCRLKAQRTARCGRDVAYLKENNEKSRQTKLEDAAAALIDDNKDRLKRDLALISGETIDTAAEERAAKIARKGDIRGRIGAQAWAALSKEGRKKLDGQGHHGQKEQIRALGVQHFDALSKRQQDTLLKIVKDTYPLPLPDSMIAAIKDNKPDGMAVAAEEVMYDADPDWVWLAGIEMGLTGKSLPKTMEDIWRRNPTPVALAEWGLGIDYWGKLDEKQQQAILTLINGAGTTGLDLIPLLEGLPFTTPETLPGYLASVSPLFAAHPEMMARFEEDFFHLTPAGARHWVDLAYPSAGGPVPQKSIDDLHGAIGDEAWTRLGSYEKRQAVARIWQSFGGKLPGSLLTAIKSGDAQAIVIAADAAFGGRSTNWQEQAEIQADLRNVSIEEARQMIMLRHPNAQFGGQTPAPWNPSKGDPWAGANPAEAPKESLMETILRGAASVADHLNPFSVSPAYGAEVVPPTLSGPGGASAGPANSDSPAVPAAINAGSGGAGAAGLPGQRVGMKYAGASLPSWSAAAAMEALVEPPHAPEPPHKPGAPASGHSRLSMLLPYDPSAEAETAQGSAAASPAPLSMAQKSAMVEHLIAELNKGQFGSRLIDALFRAVMKRMDRELLQPPRSGPRFDSRLSPLHPAMPYDGR